MTAILCPSCESDKTIPIVYGLPNRLRRNEDEDYRDPFEAERRGELILGGCLYGDDYPNRKCKGCGHQWLYDPVPHLKRVK